jgi:hypothetical protein
MGAAGRGSSDRGWFSGLNSGAKSGRAAHLDLRKNVAFSHDVLALLCADAQTLGQHFQSVVISSHLHHTRINNTQ